MPNEIVNSAPVCSRCNGTGVWHSPRANFTGPCFACQPTTGSCRQDAGARNWTAFYQRYPLEGEWLLGNERHNEFAASLIRGCRRYGGLTPRQLAAVQRNLGQSVTAPPVSQPVLTRINDRIIIEADPVRRALDAAAASGLRKVRLDLGRVTFKLSGSRWRHGAGMILCYEGGSYAGWIDRQNGWHAAYLHPVVTEEKLNAFRAAAADPQAAARTHGQDTGYCSCCRRLLTDPPSVMAGIGPICIQRFGWSR